MSSTGIETVKEVGQCQKNSTTTVVARVVDVHGRRCGDIRQHVRSAAGALTPTKQGLCLTVDKLPELAALVNALVEAAGVADEGDDDEPDEDTSEGAQPC